jgi:hypothetical protein
MAETLKLPSSTRFSRSADRSNIQGSAISRVEKGNRMSLVGPKRLLVDGQSMSALPGHIRHQPVPLS